MYRGWTQVAFDTDLSKDVAPVDIAGRALIAIRGTAGAEVYDGRCPHRGAHLGYGGQLDNGVIICPFHGHRVVLAERGQSTSRGGPFAVCGYPTVQAAGGVFALLDPALDTGLAERLTALSQTHFVRPAFERAVAVGPEYVIENVLDADHFAAVHGVSRRPRLTVEERPGGTLRVDGELDVVRANQWQGGSRPDEPARARFSAEVYSPTVVVTELGSETDPHVVITAATPVASGGCLARVTVALPRQSRNGAPTVRQLSSLVSGSRTAFEQDALIWDHVDTTMPPHYLPGDQLVQTYRAFCERFDDQDRVE